MLSELLTIQEAAAYTRQAPSAIRRKIRDGGLQAARLGKASSCISDPHTVHTVATMATLDVRSRSLKRSLAD
jgi:excisionase family DNA binding protein